MLFANPERAAVTDLLVSLVPLALVDSVSPVRLAALVAVLGSRRPIADSAAFLVALAASYYLVGLLIALGVDRLFDYLFPTDPKPIDFALGGLVGLGLVVFGSRNLRRPHMEREPRKGFSEGRSPFLLAIKINAATGLAGLPYIAAIDLMLRSELPDWQLLLALAFYCAVFMMPFAALVLTRILLGRRADRLLERINRAIGEWMPRMMAVLFVLLGLVLLVDAGGYFLFDRPLW